MHLKRFFRLSGTTLLLFHGVLLGCGGSSDLSGGVTDYVSQIAAVLGGTGRATLRSGSLPTGGTSTVNAALSGVVVRGGSTLVTVTPSGGNAVVIGIAGVTSNYWELTNLTGNSLLAVNFAQNPPQSTFNLQVAAGNGTSYGTPQSVPVQPLAGVGGTSDVQVSL